IDMGAVPDMLPGRGILADPVNRKYWESKYEISMSPDPGLDMVRMILEAEKGNLKALYVMGENPVRSLPQSPRVIKGFQNLEFLVVQDILTTEMTEMADVVLPGAAFSEKSGSFTNMEGRIQCFNPVVDPPGEAMPDWEIIDRLMEKTGIAKRYDTINRIRNEINYNVSMYADLNGNNPQAWIRVNENIKLFNDKKVGELIPFIPVKGISHEEKLNSEYPFKAVLSPVRYHLGSGTRTGYSKRIKNFFNDGVVEISPSDSRRMALEETDTVAISSLYGSIKREVRINESLKEGTVIVPMAFNNNDVMNLLNLNFIENEVPSCRNVCEVKLEKYNPPGDV
ncbi:molybdopterin oxidoreductase family protein, partial [Thermodesulfobacteriota bacterium]